MQEDKLQKLCQGYSSPRFNVHEIPLLSIDYLIIIVQKILEVVLCVFN